jgi:hypothetical protein
MLATQQEKHGEITGGRKRKKICDGKNSRKSSEKKDKRAIEYMHTRSYR